MQFLSEKNQMHRFLWFSPCANDLNIYDAKKLLRIAKRLHATVVHFPATGASSPDTVKAFYQSSVIPQPDWLHGRDLLAEAIDEGKKLGIKIVAYFNGHWFPSEFFTTRQDWVMRSVDGAAISLGSSYGSGEVPCVNSPGFIKYTQLIMDEISRNYAVDGIFLDGPVYRPEGCYCESCRNAFHELYHAEIPITSDWNNPLWYKFLEFRYESLFRYFSMVQQTVKKNKNIPVYKNAAVLTTTWFSCLDIEKFSKYIDMIGAEHFIFYIEPLLVPHWGAAAVAKYESAVARAAGIPSSVYLCYGHKVWDYYPVPATEMRLLIASVAANDSYPFVTIDDEQIVNDPVAFQPIEEIFGFIERNESVYLAESANPVALFWSNTTADYYTRSVIAGASGTHHYEIRSGKDYQSEFRGVYEALSQAHIPFDIIGSINIDRGELSRYHVLILPNAAALSESNVAMIRDYVNRGGSIIATYETSLYNELGVKQNEFQLAEVFGITYENDTALTITNRDYQKIVITHAITGKGKGLKIPVPDLNVFVKVVNPKYKPVTKILKPLPHRYHPLQETSHYPGIVVGQYGLGKVVYFSGTVGTLYYKFRIRDIKKFIANAVCWMVPDLIRVDAPSSVEITLTKNEQGLYVHLINYSTRISRPIEEVVPVSNIKLTLPNGNKIRTVYAVSTNRQLRVKHLNGSVTITLPNLNEYEIIHIIWR